MNMMSSSVCRLTLGTKILIRQDLYQFELNFFFCRICKIKNYVFKKLNITHFKQFTYGQFSGG